MAAKKGYGPFLARSWNRHSVDDVGDHALGRQPVARGVRPEPDAVAEDVLCEVLDVFRVDLRAPADQQRPYLRQAAPADDRARRGTEIDAVLDELGRRMRVPVRLGV